MPKPGKTTRRASWMERHTEIRKSGRGKYTLYLKIGNQTFMVGGLGGWTFSEAKWTRDMLCIALDVLYRDGVGHGLSIARRAVTGTVDKLILSEV